MATRPGPQVAPAAGIGRLVDAGQRDPRASSLSASDGLGDRVDAGDAVDLRGPIPGRASPGRSEQGSGQGRQPLSGSYMSSSGTGC